jgi:ethanolamine transporter
MGISEIIMLIMAVFFVLGALDRLFGSRLGLGAEFERAFGLMGPTALAALGLLALAPVLAVSLQTVIAPVLSLVGADPAMLPGVLLSCEIGYPLSAEITADPRLGLFGGIIVGSVMGFIISFTIPVACGLIGKEDYKPLATGILAAYIFDPAACFIGGLAMGLPPVTILINLIPVIAVALLVVLGLLFAPAGTIRIFQIFAKLLLAVITVGLAAAVEAMTGFVLIPGMNPIGEGFKTIGTIVLSLGGSLPLLLVLRRVLHRPLDRLGARLGLNDVSMLSIILAITSLVPGYSCFADMNPRGKVMFAAFSASAGCMLGCPLGFTSSVDQAIVMPMLLAKCCAGIFAMASGAFFARRLVSEQTPEQI